ncbi:MAG: sialate O-acetylesterase [Opitutaceae bacterium]|jgi:sialate O-acetylesterase
MSTSTLRLLALLASLCAFALKASADVTPALPFQSHAVLQQGRALPVWGKADAGEKVTVTYAVGATTRTASATAGTDGRWRTELPALAASAEAATLSFAGKNTVTLTDILVGEVWLASGQSNMEYALSWGYIITNAKTEIANADHPLIREIKIKPLAADTPQDTAPGSWRVCSPSTVGNFSAAAYFFARELRQKLNVPVGIINASWGGSLIEPFMTPAALAADANGPAILASWKQKTADYPAKKARYDTDKAAWSAAKIAAEKAGEKFTQKAPGLPPGPGHQATPAGSYNAMIYPLVPYAIRGVIWYQGESNAGRHVEYRTFFPSLISGWREVFKQPDLPFYWVQLAAYGANDPDGVGFPWLRDAQDRTLSVPHTGQALTIDIGDSGNIHPANKQDVGRRLALLALRRTYGQKDVIDSGPTFAKAELNAGAPNRIRVKFDNIAAGLKNTNAAAPDAVLGFDVAGADKNFRPATAAIENAASGLVLITAPDNVPAPLYVRYAWHNYPKNSLSNSEGLPTAPFHTDP